MKYLFNLKRNLYLSLFIFILYPFNSALANAASDSTKVLPEITEIGSGIWQLRFGQPEKFTPSTFRRNQIMINELSKIPAPNDLPFKLTQIECEIRSSRTLVSIPYSEPGERIYGFGLDPQAYDQTGLRKWLSVSSKVQGQTGASHGPIPFYISTKGYGVYVETARVPFVHVARLVKNTTASNAKNENKELEVVFDLPGNNQGVDVYVFAGPTMREVVQRYNLFSGGGCIPPLWGLGLKYRVHHKSSKQDVLKIANQLRELKIPCDMIGFEPGWQSAAYPSSLVWSSDRFPDHKDLIHDLTNKGFRLNIWEHAYIHPTSPLFEPLKNRSGDYLVWKGLVVDFADPVASKIFSDYHESYFVENGISGFKLDECDRQIVTDVIAFNFPYLSSFPSGIDGDQMTQLFGYLYQQSIYSVFKKRNMRTWGDVRATTALSAPLPFNLYSDAYLYDEYLRQLVNASFTGLLWSPEVRGTKTINDLMNRLTMACFAPQMCLNRWYNPNPVWEQYDQEKNNANISLPATEQEFIADKLREIAELRMSFIPYLYSSFFRYRYEGLPPIRSLLLDFPEDKNLKDIDDQFLFGDNIMVAPFPDDQCYRLVYFPTGCNWIDYYSHKRYIGGTENMIIGEAGKMPLFVRENSFIPIAKPVQYVDNNTVFEITVKVFGDNPITFTLIEDDGETLDYQKGLYNKVKLTWNKNKGNVDRSENWQGKRYKIIGFEKMEVQNE